MKGLRSDGKVRKLQFLLKLSSGIDFTDRQTAKQNRCPLLLATPAYFDHAHLLYQEHASAINCAVTLETLMASRESLSSDYRRPPLDSRANSQRTSSLYSPCVVLYRRWRPMDEALSHGANFFFLLFAFCAVRRASWQIDVDNYHYRFAHVPKWVRSFSLF